MAFEAPESITQSDKTQNAFFEISKITQWVLENSPHEVGKNYGKREAWSPNLAAVARMRDFRDLASWEKYHFSDIQYESSEHSIS